jgi:hypothetical protein
MVSVVFNAFLAISFIMVRNNHNSDAVIPPPVLDPALNTASPYYVHPNENLAISIVTKQLNPNNYHSWARLMRKALIGKNNSSLLMV